MKKNIYPDYQPDFINYKFRNEKEFIYSLESVANKKKGEYLYVREGQFRLVGKIQKFIQKIRGWIGLKDYTNIYHIQSSTLKLLYHGQAQGFLSNPQAQSFIEKIKKGFESKQKNNPTFLQFIQEIINPESQLPSENLTILRKTLKAFHKTKDIKDHLKPGLLEKLFTKPLIKTSHPHFGDIHLKMAKRYQDSKEFSKALEQYVKAENIKNNNSEFQSSIIEQLLLFLINYHPTRKQLQKIVLPLLHRLTHNAFSQQNYEEAQRCLTTALKFDPQNKKLKLKLLEARFHLKTLNHLSHDNEQLFLDEIDHYLKLGLSNDKTIDKASLDTRVGELYDILGKTLYKTQEDTETALRAVHYLEQSLFYSPNPHKEKELNDLYLTTCVKILAYPPHPAIHVMNEVMLLLDKVQERGHESIIDSIDQLIQLLEKGNKEAEAVQLYEYSLIQGYDKASIHIQGRTFYTLARKLTPPLLTKNMQRIEEVINLYIQSKEHGFQQENELIRLSLWRAEQKKNSEPQQTIEQLLKTLKVCEHKNAIIEKLVECHKLQMTTLLDPLLKTEEASPAEIYKVFKDNIHQLLFHYDELMDLEPKNPIHAFNKAFLIESLDLVNLEDQEISREDLDEYKLFFQIQNEETIKFWSEVLPDLERKLETHLPLPFDRVLKEYISRLYFQLGVFKKAHIDEQSIKFLENAWKYAPEADDYREALFNAYLKIAEKISNQYALARWLLGAKSPVEYQKKALGLLPHTFGSHIAPLIKYYSERQEYSKAVNLYKQWSNEPGVSIAPDILYHYSKQLEEQNALEEAYEILQCAIDLKASKQYQDKLFVITQKILQDHEITTEKALNYLNQTLPICKTPQQQLLLKDTFLQAYSPHIQKVLQENNPEAAKNLYNQTFELELTDEQDKQLRQPMINYYKNLVKEEIKQVYDINRSLSYTDLGNELFLKQESFHLLFKYYDALIDLDLDNPEYLFDKGLLIDYYFLEDYEELFHFSPNTAHELFSKAVSLKSNWCYLWMLHMSENTQKVRGLESKTKTPQLQKHQNMPEEIRVKLNDWRRDLFQTAKFDETFNPHTDAILEEKKSILTELISKTLSFIWK